jgi:hypothetical protein
MQKLAAIPLVAGALALLFGAHAFVNYDTAYALLWGSDLAGGVRPDIELPLAPTPHPLANAAGMVLTPGAVDVLSYVFLGLAAYLVFRLGEEWFGTAAGVVGALLFLTREPVLSFGLRAYVDLPFVCLTLGALLLEVKRPRRGWPVLALLALAGLLRPEPWLFSAAYVLYLRNPRLLPLAALAPVLWCLHDLALTGDPLWSLLGTQDNAQELGRKTGPVDLVLYGPRRLGEILREPVLLGLVVGAVYAWKTRRRQPLAALALALVAFAILATAGLPIITRYLLLSAALACTLAGAALVAGIAHRRWAPASVAVLVALVVFAPGQVGRVERLERSIGIQEQILDDLDALPDQAASCRPVAVTNRRPVPHLALRFDDLDPAAVRVGELGDACTYVGPASPEVAERFIFDRRDPVRTLPDLPRGYRRIAGNRSWTVVSRGTATTTAEPGARP